MIDDRTAPNGEDSFAEVGDNGRDARGRWKKGHCPNPKGRPKKERFKDYNPSDTRHFFNTQIEVMTAEGPQRMDRRAALLHKVFEKAMKGGVTAQRLALAMIAENDQRLAELRFHYERMETELIHENPNFKSLDESLTISQRNELLGLATALAHYYPGQYGAILGNRDNDAEKEAFKYFEAKLASAKSEGGGPC